MCKDCGYCEYAIIETGGTIRCKIGGEAILKDIECKDYKLSRWISNDLKCYLENFK